MQNQLDLLSRIDPLSKFVKVETKNGTIKWREIGEILSEDTILLRKDGIPYQMAHKPGRKKKTDAKKKKAKTEATIQDQKLEKVYKQKRKHLANSNFLRTVRENPESVIVLKHIMEGIAGEVESMSFDRNLAERQGEATSMISNRIIQGYKAISEAWLRRKDQISESELDLSSPAFKNLLGFIVETIKECMDIAEIPREEVKLVLTKTGERMNTEAWILSARRRMRGE